MILELIKYLTNQFIGPNYTPIIIQLYQEPQSLEYILEKTQLQFNQVVEKLKYLIKINIVTIDKKNNVVLYKLLTQNILYYQRIGKYNQYMNKIFDKQQIKIIKYFLEHQTSSIQECFKQIVNKKQQQQKYKIVFIQLIKKNMIYQDQKAYDFKVCQMIEQNKQVIPEKVPQIQKMPEKQKNKKKIQKIQVKTITENIDFKTLEKHYYNVSKLTILNHIFDYLLAQKVINKYQLQQQQKYVVNIINSDKYTFPLDHFISKDKNSKIALIQSIQSNIIQDFIAEKYTKNCLLVYNILIEYPYIDQKQIIRRSMLEVKQVRQSCNLLVQNSVARTLQVKVQKINTIVYYCQKAVKLFLRNLQKMLLNLHILSKKLQNEYNKQLIKGGEVSFQNLIKIEVAISRLDDLLILFNY